MYFGEKNIVNLLPSCFIILFVHIYIKNLLFYYV